MDSAQGILVQGVSLLESVHFSFASLFQIALTIIVGNVGLLFISRALKRFGHMRHMGTGDQQAVMQILSYIVWLLVAVFILHIIGVNLTLLIASSAALLIGLGFALQQIFSSIMSGIVLLVEGSIRVGDVLKVDNEVVRVMHVGLRTSKVVSRDDIVSIIPNAILVSSKITNWSHEKEATRFRLTISVAYATDIDLASKLLVESALESPVNLRETPPEGRLLDFGEYGVKLELLFWSRENFRIERALSDIRKSILRKFRENHIEIPYPQHVIHISEKDLPRLPYTDSNRHHLEKT